MVAPQAAVGFLQRLLLCHTALHQFKILLALFGGALRQVDPAAGRMVPQDRGRDLHIAGDLVAEAQEFIDVGGKDVEGVALSTAFDREKATTPEAKKFLDEYVKEYKGEPSALTAMAYDAYLIAIDGIKRAGSTDTVKIRDAIAATKDLECVTGMTTLDKNGDPIKGAVIKTVKDGKFTFLDFVEAK